MQRGQASALNGGSVRDRRRSNDRDFNLRGDGGGRLDRPSKPGGGPRPVQGGGYGHFGSGYGRPTVSERTESVGHSIVSGRATSNSGLHQVDRERPLNEKLNDLATCLIGQWVDVQITSGQWYTAIFHSCGDTEEGFGLKLKMARLKDAKGGKGSKSEAASRIMPYGDLKISGKDFAQIVAKEVNLSLDASSNGKPRDVKEEIATDAALSRGRLGGAERELTPWKPEGGDEIPRNMRLESSGWGSRGQGWDQFEANAQLFGVQSTFDEEIYTTKLDKKNTPEAKEREREAIRIAREIESQSTRNMHLAEERGQKLDSATEALGEEARYSSVLRAKGDTVDDGAEDEEEDDEEEDGIDTRNDETFGNGHAVPETKEPKSPPQSSLLGKSLSSSALTTPVRVGADGADQRATNGVVKDGQSPLGERRTSSAEKSDLMMGDGLAKLRLRLTTSVKGVSKGGRSPYHSPMGRSPLMSPLVGDSAVIHMLNLDPSCPNVSEDVVRDFHEFKSAKAGKRRFDEELNDFKSFSLSLKDRSVEPRSPLAAARPLHLSCGSPAGSRPSSSHSLRSAQPGLSVSSSSGGLSGLSTALPPTSSNVSTLVESATPATKAERSIPTPSTLAAGPTPSTAPTVGSSSLGAVPPVSNSGNVASPTSSAASSAASSSFNGASSKKPSSLNPNAKEFKLNPNAKAFTPTVSSTPARPAAPAAPPATPAPPPPHVAPPPAGPSVFVPTGMAHSANIPLSPIPQFVQPGQPFQSYQTAIANAPPGAYPIGLQGGFMQAGIPQVAGQMFAAQQQLRGYSPNGPHMQPQLFYPAGQIPQYPPPGVMYGQGQPVVYLQMSPGMQQQHMMTQQAVQQQPGPPPPQGVTHAGGLQYQPSQQIMGGAQHAMQHPHMPPHMGQGPMQAQMAQGGMPGGPGGGNNSARGGRGGGGGQQQLSPQ